MIINEDLPVIVILVSNNANRLEFVVIYQSISMYVVVPWEERN